MSCKKNCGCSDGANTTYEGLCNEIDCASPPACEEYFASQCIVLDGYGIVDLFTDVNPSMLELIQRLTLQINNPSCISGGLCDSTPLAYPTEVTTTTISLWWKEVASSVTYQVKYKTVAAGSFTSLATQTTNTATITGLVTATSYHVKITNACGSGGPCDSVTLLITTK